MDLRTAELPNGSIDHVDTGGDGAAVLVLDGYGSRLLGALAQGVASDVGVRIIAPDRPGYWKSHARAGDVMETWPAAARELLDHLEVDSAAVVASSAACPLAFAMAASLGSRISAVGIVGPMAPFGDVSDMTDMHPAQLRTFRMAQRLPAVGAGSMRMMGRLARKWPARVLRMVASQRPEVDAKRMEDPALHDLMLESIPGLMGPPVGGDLRALVGDWTASVDATEQPVRIWAGSEDSVHPQSMARALEQRAPRASIVAVEGGFFACTDQLPDVLRWASNPA